MTYGPRWCHKLPSTGSLAAADQGGFFLSFLNGTSAVMNRHRHLGQRDLKLNFSSNVLSFSSNVLKFDK